MHMLKSIQHMHEDDVLLVCFVFAVILFGKVVVEFIFWMKWVGICTVAVPCLSVGSWYSPGVPVVETQSNFIDSVRMWHHHVKSILKKRRAQMIDSYGLYLKRGGSFSSEHASFCTWALTLTLTLSYCNCSGTHLIQCRQAQKLLCSQNNCVLEQ